MFKSFFHGIARALTLPRSVRNKINNDPLTATAKNLLLADLLQGVSSAVDKHVSDPGQNAAVKMALGHAIDMTGIAK